MRKLFALLMTIAFLGSTSFIYAATTTGSTSTKTVKSHKGKGKGKHKVALNPQPLPPRVLPPAANGAKIDKPQ